jgi:hypothetical protein
MFTKILQYIWAFTALLSLGFSIYKFVTIQQITHDVYFPFFISIFCGVLFLNLRSQNRFRDKMEADKNQPVQ